MTFPTGYISRSVRALAGMPVPVAPPPGEGRAMEARQVLLDQIGAFLARHDLAVTAQNLAVVCGALSGADSELSAALVRRELAGEPIDQPWVDALAGLDPDADRRMRALETLADQLEDALKQFAQTARTAQSETSDHRGAIGAQLDSLAGVGGLAQVLDLSRAMIERIGAVEAAMARSEAETERLRARLAEARSEADVDHLTSLPNRRAFERELRAAAIEARSRNQPLSLAFCDVDHFKQVNDRHGHAAGDRVLCAIAAGLSEATCFTARHGGEEFVLLFHGLGKDAARDQLDAIRRAQAARVLMNRETGKPFGRITFSAGVAEVTESPDTRSALARADAALYRAKQLGRNRVELG